MRLHMKQRAFNWPLAITALLCGLNTASSQTIPLWGMFETSMENTKSYANKFRDVTLNTTFTAPSGEKTDFWGFFDGDGTGGGNDFSGLAPKPDYAGEMSGTIWKLRFMPTETGTWKYTWSFSDGSKSGTGSFKCVAASARPGVLQPLKSNSFWFQTPDGVPFFPRSLNIRFSALPYPTSVFGPSIYKKALDNGYNIAQIAMLPLWGWETWTLQKGVTANPNFLIWYQKKPSTGSDDGTYFDTERMNLFAWKRVEDHVSYLADRGMYIMPFQGFAVKRTLPGYRRPDQFPEEKARWFLRYCMARLAPFYNMIWKYTWEVDPGDGRTDEFGQWLDEFDPWDHMYTAHAANGGDFSSGIYDFSSIEVGPGTYHGNAETALDYHRYAKPIFMIEDLGPLWRRVGQDHAKALDKGWRLICNGSFFSWTETDWKEFGWSSPTTQNYWKEHFAHSMSSYITILYRFIAEETDFANLRPHAELTSVPNALADPGNQYVIYKQDGGTFTVNLAAGSYSATWINPFDDKRVNAGTVNGPGNKSFTTPQPKHFVLFLKNKDATATRRSFPAIAQRLTAHAASNERLISPDGRVLATRRSSAGNCNAISRKYNRVILVADENGQLIRKMVTLR